MFSRTGSFGLNSLRSILLSEIVKRRRTARVGAGPLIALEDVEIVALPARRERLQPSQDLVDDERLQPALGGLLSTDVRAGTTAEGDGAPALTRAESST